jgi:hypothetical protein
MVGENLCENPQPVCPREDGEDYTKCKTICRQGGHAELQALDLVGGVADSGVAVVRGHTYACRECQEALFSAGVLWLRVDSRAVE